MRLKITLTYHRSQFGYQEQNYSYTTIVRFSTLFLPNLLMLLNNLCHGIWTREIHERRRIFHNFSKTADILDTFLQTSYQTEVLARPHRFVFCTAFSHIVPEQEVGHPLKYSRTMP